LYFRRITAVLINLIDGKYPIILADIAKFGLPEDFAERYEIAIAAAFSHAFLGDDVRAAYYLLEAKASRERFGSLSDENGVFNRIYGEVIALCSVGRWFQAKRILSQQGEAFVGSPTFYEVLKLLSDGPPFAGVSATLRPFAARPYFGMLALLANRVIEKWSGQQKEPLLTAAETDVLRLIGLGKSNKDIANVRSRSTETVKRQVASLLRKLGVENRTSAVTVARERGLL
jgi:DNA-binding CsgD family transcriptional regulator